MRVRTLLAATAAAGITIAAVTLGGLSAEAETSNAKDDVHGKIVGGTPVAEPYSFMVSLQDSAGDHFCGASLIRPDFAVTAAHCVEGQDPASMQVRVNTTDRTNGGETAAVTEATIHPDYDPIATGHNDIAVIKLDTQLQATPIEVGTSPETGSAVRIIGWGLTCPVRGCGEPPVELQELETSALDDAECESPQGGIDPAAEICVDNPNEEAGACFGDSGGPAVVDEGGTLKLVGATSRGLAAECATTPAIYSDVTAQADFINGVIGGGEAPGDGTGEG